MSERLPLANLSGPDVNQRCCAFRVPYAGHDMGIIIMRMSNPKEISPFCALCPSCEGPELRTDTMTALSPEPIID